MDEKRAREILGSAFREDGSLSAIEHEDNDHMEFVVWDGGEFARLDGDFRADELEAIAWAMRNKIGGQRGSPTEDALSVLREIEWNGGLSGTYGPVCPSCGADADEIGEKLHAPGCRLAALINPTR